MARPITLADLPEDLARFAEARIAAGLSANVEDVLRAGIHALRASAQAEWLSTLRQDAREGFAAFDRGEGVATTADELVDGIEKELGIGR